MDIQWETDGRYERAKVNGVEIGFMHPHNNPRGKSKYQVAVLDKYEGRSWNCDSREEAEQRIRKEWVCSGCGSRL